MKYYGFSPEEGNVMISVEVVFVQVLSIHSMIRTYYYYYFILINL